MRRKSLLKLDGYEQTVTKEEALEILSKENKEFSVGRVVDTDTPFPEIIVPESSTFDVSQLKRKTPRLLSRD